MSYDRRVKFRQLFLIALASSAMLSMQMAGWHMHVGTHGGDAELHGSHSHDVDSDGHDHRGDVDIPIVEYGATGSETGTLFLATTIAKLTLPWLRATIWAPPQRGSPVDQRSRWRPPLRAPPFSS